MEYFVFPEDAEAPQPTTDVTTYADGSLVQTSDGADHTHFNSAQPMMRSRLVEDAGVSRPTQDQFSQTGFPTPLSPLARTRALHFNVALRPTPAAGHSTPFSYGPFWQYGAPVPESQQSQTSVGLEMTDLWVPTSSCTCMGLPSECICVRPLRSAVPWDETAPEAGYRGEGDVYNAQPSNENYSVAVNDPFEPLALPPQQFMDAQGDSYLCISEQDRAQYTTHQNVLPSGLSGPAYSPHSPMPPTPHSPTYPTTPSSSGASTSYSQEGLTTSIQASSPRKRRPRRSARGAPPNPSRNQSALVLSMEPEDAKALTDAREGVQQFVNGHPHTVEPSIGDPAATAIIGSNHGLGTPGKSLYSLFFSSRSGKPPFTCLECGLVESRASRAVRHQRQHFDHKPFKCQGATGHPACDQWFASDEYATDHAKKAGSPTFPCSQCTSEFPNSGNLGRHLKLVHRARR